MAPEKQSFKVMPKLGKIPSLKTDAKMIEVALKARIENKGEITEADAKK